MKSVLVIGLGRFGKHIVEKLNEMHYEIMAVDRSEKRVNDPELLSLVTDAQIGDVTSKPFLRSLGVDNYDVCFVAIGDDFQSSLEVTSLLNELGAKKVVSRASRDVSGKVDVVKDDYIGFVGDHIYVDEKTAESAMLSLCDKLGAGDYDILLILAGADPTEQNAAKMADELKARYNRSEVIMFNGGQPIYDYILILE